MHTHQKSSDHPVATNDATRAVPLADMMIIRLPDSEGLATAHLPPPA
jgi:hypothetical protein